MILWFDCASVPLAILSMNFLLIGLWALATNTYSWNHRKKKDD